VKNNLQVVMSLLSLQAAQSANPTVREALSQAQARINALALVHRLLNEVEDQTSVDLQRLLNELTRQVVDGFGPARPEISVTVDAMALSIAGETAVPIALFTVEALANIFKHAFPQSDNGGVVSVTLRWLDGIGYRLAIQDNGVGFATGDTKPGIGDRLLKVFGRQIHGTVAIVSDPGKGTCVELVFAGPDIGENDLEDRGASAERISAQV
jgi:two-component sensor histidine kinase